MQHSDSIDKLAKALVAAQAQMPTAPRLNTNPHFKNRYADLPTLWDTCRPVLGTHGLAVTQTFEPAASGIVITTTLLHESGQWMSGSLSLPLDKPTPQAAGSAITYGRRYALAAILGMVSDEDDDAEATNRQPAQQNHQNGKAKPAPAKTLAANPADVAELRRLIANAQVADEIVVAWLDHAGVGDLADMPQNAVEKCIAHIQAKYLSAGTKKPATVNA